MCAERSEAPFAICLRPADVRLPKGEQVDELALPLASGCAQARAQAVQAAVTALTNFLRFRCRWHAATV
jgi:hypothetical protein